MGKEDYFLSFSVPPPSSVSPKFPGIPWPAKSLAAIRRWKLAWRPGGGFTLGRIGIWWSFGFNERKASSLYTRWKINMEPKNTPLDPNLTLNKWKCGHKPRDKPQLSSFSSRNAGTQTSTRRSMRSGKLPAEGRSLGPPLFFKVI